VRTLVRHLITLCALLGYLAGQMAAFPHTHVEDNTSGDHHSSVPHVHLSWLAGTPHTHDHNHRHGHHLNGHHHKSAHEAMRPTASISCNQDHDADALYFVAGTTGMMARVGSGLLLKAPPAHLLFICAGAPIDGRGRGFGAPPHPPDCGHLGCPLYLELRTLRI